MQKLKPLPVFLSILLFISCKTVVIPWSGYVDVYLVGVNLGDPSLPFYHRPVHWILESKNVRCKRYGETYSLKGYYKWREVVAIQWDTTCWKDGFFFLNDIATPPTNRPGNLKGSISLKDSSGQLVKVMDVILGFSNVHETADSTFQITILGNVDTANKRWTDYELDGRIVLSKAAFK